MRFLTLTFLGLVGAASIAEEVDQRLDAASDGVVSISNIAGSVEVPGWSREEVEVTGTLGKDVEELVFERDGNEIEITVKAPKRHRHGISSDLVINVPEKSSLEVVCVSSEIEIQNVHGVQHLQSVSGDIESEAHSADIELVSVSGDIEVEGDDKAIRAELSSVSGDIDAQNLAGEVVTDTVNGDISLVDSKFDRARLETVNGDVVFDSALLKEGSFGLETINGDLDITFNGDIRNCFGPKPVRTSKYAPGTELKFKQGGGEGRVKIQTLNGDLRLCKD